MVDKSVAKLLTVIFLLHKFGAVRYLFFVVNAVEYSQAHKIVATLFGPEGWLAHSSSEAMDHRARVDILTAYTRSPLGDNGHAWARDS